MEELSEKGSSASWSRQKKNFLRIFEVFRRSSVEAAAAYTAEFTELPASIVCAQQVYARLANFLLHHYVIETGENKGHPLACSNVVNTVSGLINIAADKFRATGSDAIKLFFTCLDKDASTADAVWLRGLKKNMNKFGFEKAKGEKMDNSDGAIISHPPSSC